MVMMLIKEHQHPPTPHWNFATSKKSIWKLLQMRRLSAPLSDPGTSLMSQSDTDPPIKIRSSLSRKIRHGVLHKSQIPGGPAAKKSDKVFCGKDLVASRPRPQKLRCIASFCRHHQVNWIHRKPFSQKMSINCLYEWAFLCLLKAYLVLRRRYYVAAKSC